MTRQWIIDTSYAEQECKSQEINAKTKIMIAAGQYREAFELYKADPLAVEGITLEQFVSGTIEEMRRAFQNFQTMEAHDRSMGQTG